jgi:hypothetical protein
MTRNTVPFAWGVGLGIAVCFGLSIVGYFASLGGAPKFFVTYARYLWPSSLFLNNPALEHNWGLLCALLALSVTANALIYGGLFVSVALIVRKLRAK